MESLLVVVMVVALVFAIAMSVFAWRVLRRDRERSDVRVARLRALASTAAPVPDFAFDAPTPPTPPAPPAPLAPSHDLFTPHAPAPGWGRAVVVVAVFMAIGAGTVYGLYNTEMPIAWPSRSPAAAPAPLELLSLTHRRDGRDFIVTGLVQNPGGARPTPGLQAVVFLFDGKGEYFTSGKAVLELPSIPSGEVSPFMVRIAGVDTVTRYRLGFRLDDGSTFAHVDRRGEPMTGTTAAVVEEGR